jgi:hypothetical protein
MTMNNKIQILISIYRLNKNGVATAHIICVSVIYIYVYLLQLHIYTAIYI